jgi:putative FmdB family regulatory protein
MALYEYQCDVCGHRFEVIQKWSDPQKDTCPKCGGAVHKLQSAPAFQFKGTGWYVTDYAKKDQGGSNRSSGDSGSDSKASSSESSERSEKSEKSDKNDKAEKSEKSEKSDKTERSEKTSDSSKGTSSGDSSSSSTATTPPKTS